MVCRNAAVLGGEIAVEQQLVRSVAIQVAPAEVAIVVAIVVDIVEYQFLDSCRAEGYGSLHILPLEEAVNTCQPAISILLLRAKHEVFSYLVLLFALFEREVVFGQKVVVDVHPIVHILIRSDARQREFFKFVANAQSVIQGNATVGARLVVADLTHQLLAVLVGVWRADIFIRVSALLHYREGERVVDAQRPLAVLEFGAEVTAILLVA